MVMKPCKNLYDHSTTVQAIATFQLWSARNHDRTFSLVVGAVDVRLQENRDQRKNESKASVSRVSKQFFTLFETFLLSRLGDFRYSPATVLKLKLFF